MITINKELPDNILIVTVSDVNTAINPAYQLVIESDFTNKSYSFDLPANTSPYPSRYDEFVLAMAAYAEEDYSEEDYMVDGMGSCESGLYNYKIIETTTSKICEVGLLKIVESIKTEQQELNDTYTVIEPEATDDDYIVYEA